MYSILNWIGITQFWLYHFSYLAQEVNDDKSPLRDDLPFSKWVFYRKWTKYYHRSIKNECAPFFWYQIIFIFWHFKWNYDEDFYNVKYYFIPFIRTIMPRRFLIMFLQINGLVIQYRRQDLLLFYIFQFI